MRGPGSLGAYTRGECFEEWGWGFKHFTAAKDEPTLAVQSSTDRLPVADGAAASRAISREVALDGDEAQGQGGIECDMEVNLGCGEGRERGKKGLGEKCVKERTTCRFN